MTNPFRPESAASLRRNGEAQKAGPTEGLCREGSGVEGDWGWNALKAGHVKWGDPRGSAGASRPAEVGAPIRALKRGNARGAKGRRKVETE
jgi:hypothetical protein